MPKNIKNKRRRRTAVRVIKPYNDDYRDGFDDLDSDSFEVDPEAAEERYRRWVEDRKREEAREREEARREEARLREDARREEVRERREERRFEAREREDARRHEVRRREEERRYAEERRRRSREKARRGSRGTPPRRRGGGCLVPILVLFLLAGSLTLASAYVLFLWNKVDMANFRSAEVAVNSDLPDSVKKFTRDYKTIMVFGVDSRDNTTLQEGTLADSNIIVAIHRRTGDIKLLSIYRDTYVETTDGEHMKLTEVYMKYGAKEQLQTINKNFDMNVSDYVTVNWKTVADVINSVDGIDIELSSAECKGINKYIDEVIKSTGVSSSHVDVKDGRQHLDGVQAVTFCRLRKGLGDDYRRTERQRQVVALTLAKAKQKGIFQALDVCSRVFPGLSSSLSLTEVMQLAAVMGRYEITESAGFPFDEVSQGSGRYYIFPVTLASNAKKLHEYLYGNTAYEPSETVKNLSKKVSEVSGH